MSDMRHYMGMSIMGRMLMRNFAPDELQTVRLTKTQFGALISALSSDLPENATPNATTPHQCSLVAYQAGFQDSVLERQELEKNRAPEAHPSRETYEQQMCPLCSAQFSNHSNTNSPSSSPRSVPKDARTDSTSETGSGTVAQDTQTERPAYETLRSLDGTIHQGVKMEAQPASVSRQTNSSALKDVSQEVSLEEKSFAQKNATAYRLLDDAHSQQEPSRSNPHKACSPSCLQEGFSHPSLQEQNHTSSSPSSASKDARADSHSKAGNETVAQPAFELSVEELLQINRGFIPEALKIRALNELKRRSGEGKASS